MITMQGLVYSILKRTKEALKHEALKQQSAETGNRHSLDICRKQAGFSFQVKRINSTLVSGRGNALKTIAKFKISRNLKSVMAFSAEFLYHKTTYWVFEKVQYHYFMSNISEFFNGILSNCNANLRGSPSIIFASLVLTSTSTEQQIILGPITI